MPVAKATARRSAYKFKTRSTFSAEAALIDDDYALEVLAKVRATRDKALLEMADRFEAARFPEGVPAREEADLDLPFQTAG